MAPDKKTITMAEFTILKLHPGKTPAGIDLRLDKAIEIMGDPGRKDVLVQAIYSLQGDTLRLFADDEETRPKAFPDGVRQGVATFQRVKGK